MVFVYLNSPLDRILNIWEVTLQIICNFDIKLFNDITKIVI